MKEIILPTDFSDNAWRAMCYAANLFSNTPCNFHIINTFSYPYSFNEAGVLMPIDPLREDSEEQLELTLNRFKELNHHNSSTFETKSIYGSLVTAIISFEESFSERPLIIMGTKGKEGIGEIFFGTMTSSIIRQASSTVISVPDSANLSTPKSIMLAIDDQGLNSKKEIQPLLDLIEGYAAEVAIVNVNNNESSADEDSKENIEIDQYLTGIKHFYHEILSENKEEALSDYAKDNEIDLIALIKRDKGFWRNFFHSSLTKKMAFYSDVPLLILRGSAIE